MTETFRMNEHTVGLFNIGKNQLPLCFFFLHYISVIKSVSLAAAVTAGLFEDIQ